MGSSAAILELFPAPGEWTEEDYFEVSDRGRMVELSDGNIEVLPLPTVFHQLIIGRLYKVLDNYLLIHEFGTVGFAPIPARLWPGKIREPDLMFMTVANEHRIGRYWGIPDLAVEVISDGGSTHDRVTKRSDYTIAGVLEYWIIDPEARTVEVLRRSGETLEEIVVLREGDVLSTPLIPGWSFALSEMFAPSPRELRAMR